MQLGWLWNFYHSFLRTYAMMLLSGVWNYVGFHGPPILENQCSLFIGTPGQTRPSCVWFSHRAVLVICIAKFLIISYKSPVLRIMILDPTLCRISYHFLQKPRTPHNAVKSDALPAWISTGCTERDIFEWLFNLWLRRWVKYDLFV